MKRILIFSHLLLAILLCASSTLSAQAANQTREQAEKGSGQGIVFKVPDGFMNAPLEGFKGMALLNHDAPAVIAIAYPNDGESIEDLSKRMLAALPKFFGGAETPVDWKSTPIEVHKGDRAGSGLFHTATAGDKQLQAALFQRDWKGLTVVYGYFAMRGPKNKEKDVKKYWLDGTGSGVKGFDAFWKSFPN